MATWSRENQRAIGQTDDFHISPYRADGTTPGTPTWLWSVVVDGDVYVRAYNGISSRWYQAALRQRAGRVRAAGVDREVGFEPIDGDGEDRIDDAYRTKYADSPYLAPMVAGARPGRDGAGGSAVTVDAGQAQLTLSATTAARDDLPSRMSKAEGPAGACLGRRRHGVTIAAAP